MQNPRSTNNAGTVSVVVPVYNAQRYLGQAIESILGQEYPATEIIMVDDGSMDGSYDLARSFSGVRVIRQANGGSAAARNSGIRLATGEYLAFLDADDLWMPGKLDLQLAALQQDSNLNLVAGYVEEFYENPAIAQAVRLERHSGERAYTIGALLMRRTDFLRVGMMDEGLRFGEFMDWHSRAIALGLKERILETTVLRRRIHDRNTTQTCGEKTRDYAKALHAHLARKRSAAPEIPKAIE